MNSKTTPLSVFKLGFIFFLIANFSVFSQNKEELKSLTSSYKEYTELPREISYTHLNKTTYLKGEIMGFAVYAFDKNSKKSSKTATNIYCTISNAQQKVIKSKMILADNGVASGSFQIDSLFIAGQYTFRAYTNWMRNFDEPNYSTQTIKIKDSDAGTVIKDRAITSKLDAQFLPEGGHFVADVKNSVGVIVKDSLGFGVANIAGRVLDSENKVLIDFKTNRFGIGKFTFTPEENRSYRAVLDFNGTAQTFSIAKAENSGIALTMNDLENKVALSFRTNENTLKQIKKEDYILAIHNGNVLKTIDVDFGKSLEVVKVINYEDLNPGVNIFTLFNENNNPILERLFFKYDGISLFTAENPVTISSKDSLTITIPIKNIDAAAANNFSVSVLPEGTKSYNPTNTIISATYLQPYIKSYVENVAYYFTDITRKKKFELDNVLLTQGWSSYDWHTIFNNPPKPLYEYENGIAFRANANNKTASEYMMFATINNEMKIFNLDSNDKDFGAVGLYPMNTEKIRFSAVKKNNHIDRPSLYLQFSPSKIPELNKVENVAPLREKESSYNSSGQSILQTSWDKAEQLEEVVIKTDKVLTREDKLTQNAFGHNAVLDDSDRKSYLYFTNYIRTKGFQVFEAMGSVIILNPRKMSLGQEAKIKQKPVLVYLDNIELLNTDVLYKYTLDNVDYIFYDKSGVGEGGRGVQGVIKIFTDPTLSQSKLKINDSQDISVPLAFSSSKKFYVPEYTSYTSKFYRNYGVISWFPKLHLQKDGNIQFTIPKPKTDNLSLFIEGTANDDGFISEEKTISIN